MPDSSSKDSKRYVWVPAALFQDPPHLPGVVDTPFVPVFDVLDGDDQYLVRADVPGIRADDIDITVTEDRLTIVGERREDHIDDRRRMVTSERGHGAFTRTLPVPRGAAIRQVHAELKDGVLTVVIPKKAGGHDEG